MTLKRSNVFCLQKNKNVDIGFDIQKMVFCFIVFFIKEDMIAPLRKAFPSIFNLLHIIYQA